MYSSMFAATRFFCSCSHLSNAALATRRRVFDISEDKASINQHMGSLRLHATMFFALRSLHCAKRQLGCPLLR